MFKFDSYPDAYFAGMYGHENPTDPGRTGYIITFSDCPVL